MGDEQLDRHAQGMAPDGRVSLEVLRNRGTGACYVLVSDLVPWLETFDVEPEALDQLRLLPFEAAEGEPTMTMREIDS